MGLREMAEKVGRHPNQLLRKEPEPEVIPDTIAYLEKLALGISNVRQRDRTAFNKVQPVGYADKYGKR